MASDRIDEAAAEVGRSRARRAGVTGAAPAARADRQGGPMSSDDDRLRQLVEGIDDYAFILLDPSGRVSEWNEGARRLKGYEAEEVLGRHFALFYPLDDIERGKAQDELAAARAHGYFEEEGWRVRKGGERFLARVKLVTLYDDAGNVRGFAKLTRDLSDRERARALAAQLEKTEAQLERAERARDEAEAAERRLLTLISTMSDGYFTLDAEWRFAYVNPALARMLGTPDQDLVGRYFWDEVTDSVHSNSFKHLPGLMIGAPPVEFVEDHAATGRRFSVHAQRSEGQIVVFLRDITDEPPNPTTPTR